jgi:hypothetical protein
MNSLPAALYARVSSAQQAEAHTVARQVVALRERIAADGLPLPEALQFIDEGYSGPPQAPGVGAVARGGGRWRGGPARCPLAGSAGAHIGVPSPAGG